MKSGDQFGRYSIIRLLGRGAMGDVYLARDNENGAQVALKIVYKGPEREDQDILDAERVGAELQKRLSAVDPRVARVNRYGEIDGDLFIEMEYIDGEDLSMILARGPVQAGFAVHVAIELCDMLENLRAFTTEIGGHQFAGVVHGDLKPRNIRLNSQNYVKVLDFGIAKALSQTRKYTVNVFASAAYSSPERIETQRIDASSDLWSVGVLLYQMIAGRLPFDEESKERLERRIRSGSPDPLSPSCPEPLGRIIRKALARDPARRYQTADDLKDELVRFRAGQPVLADNPPPDDIEATVRTTVPVNDGDYPPVESDDERTVRTQRPVDEPTGGGGYRPAAAGAAVGTRAPRQIRPAMGCFAVFGIVVGILVGFVWWQYSYSKKAGDLKTDLQAEKITDLDAAWTRYQDLAGRSHLPFLLWGTKSAMKQRLIAAADSVIAEYRNNDSPSIYENQWAYAKKQLSRALEIDSDDKGIRGRLRVCEGHLDRIRAGGLKGAARQKVLNSAISEFEQAADLLKRSPDPYLGLARIYVYEMGDVDKAEDALRKAEEYGHPMGRREIAQLADGYRRRADRIWRDSRTLASAPDKERDYLDKARDDYRHAEDLYGRSGLFGDAAKGQLAAIQGQQRVEQRLNEMTGGGVVVAAPSNPQ